MDKVRDQLHSLQSRLNLIKKKLDPDDMRRRARELEAQTMKPDFWNDTFAAQRIMQELSELQTDLQQFQQLDKDFTDGLVLADLLSQDHQLTDAEAQLAAEVQKLEERFEQLEDKLFLQGPYDRNNAMISIHSGQGGTEAMDWAAMLMRMYIRFFEKRGWKIDIINQTSGEEAGIKSVTIAIHGSYAYGYLKHEAGTHRLVRLSPFNADSLRQTSFALVEVLPELPPENNEIEIKPEEIEFEAFRSGGHGGQNVNKVSTAVRIKHLPSGIVVTCQMERSQEQNRKLAMSMLRAKLWNIQHQQRRQQEAQLKGEYQAAAWGTQIRNYVLHPYKLVKDLRTEVESSDPDSVLDGDLLPFIEAEMRQLS